METSPSAIAFRGIRNVDMIPFIRDVIDTLREFDLRRLGSSKVYKTRMETELQPHLVPHWVQLLQKPPHTPFFHTRIQKWKRHNMMRVLEAAADEIAGDDLKIAEVTDALRQRVEPMGPHLQAAVHSFIQRLRLNQAGNGGGVQLNAKQTCVKLEQGTQSLIRSITTEEIKMRGQGVKPDMLPGAKRIDDCLSSNSGLKRAVPDSGVALRDEGKRQCVWDLSFSKSGDPLAPSTSSESVERVSQKQAGHSGQFAKFPVPSIDTQSILAFLKTGLAHVSTPGTTLPLLGGSLENAVAPPRKQFDLKQQYDLLSSMDDVLGPTPKPQTLTSLCQDDDASDSHSGSAGHNFDFSNGVSIYPEDDPPPEDVDFDEYQEAVFAAASIRAGDQLERELLEDSRLLLQSLLRLGESPHVGALRVALVAEKLLPVIESLLNAQDWEGLEIYTLERLTAILMNARERVQSAMEEQAEAMNVELAVDKSLQGEASRMELFVNTLLPLVGTAVFEQQPQVQLRLAAAHNRLASALSQHGWMKEAQVEMDCASAILGRLQAAPPQKRPLLPPPDCPISMERMEDPVVLTTGHTFERSAIERWINAGNTTCPITRQPLTDLELIPNEALRGYSARWHAENGLPQPQAPVWLEYTTDKADDFIGLIEKGQDLFRVDDFLNDAAKGPMSSEGSVGLNMFDIGEALKGKARDLYGPDEQVFGAGQEVWQKGSVDVSSWDLDMMQWAINA